jgi:GntR family transcriptional regulator/MocR family aminotransferase
MLPFKNLIQIEKNAAEAVFKQLARQIILLIQQGVLLPGTDLPSTRLLANELGVHRKTVMAAFSELIAEDWIQSRERIGYKVPALLPVIKPRTYSGHSNIQYTSVPEFIFDGMGSIPDLPFIPKKFKVLIDDGFPEPSVVPVGAISKEYRSLLTHANLKKSSLSWNIDGSEGFRDSLTWFLNETRGLNIQTENLLVTRGAQSAIFIAASLIIKPGDKVIVSDPSYFMANAVFTQLGAELIYVPVDHSGVDVQAIEAALAENDIKLLYIIPHHHHPTTVTLSSQRRIRLLELIKQYKLPVIEDDYDYDFQYQESPYLPLASAVHDGNVIYIGSLTKVLGANFRLGYMVSSPRFLQSAIRFKSLFDLRSDALMEGTVSHLIQNGEFSRFINKANKLYALRCNYAAELITSRLGDFVEFDKPQGGMALWLRFSPELPLREIISRASSNGLQLAGSAYYGANGKNMNAIRFGFASVNENEMEFAVDLIRKICSSGFS